MFRNKNINFKDIILAILCILLIIVLIFFNVKDITFFNVKSSHNIESNNNNNDNYNDNDNSNDNESFYDFSTDLNNTRNRSIVKFLSINKISEDNGLINNFTIKISQNSDLPKHINILTKTTDNKLKFFVEKQSDLNNKLFILNPYSGIRGNFSITNNFDPYVEIDSNYLACHFLLEDEDNNKILFNRFKLVPEINNEGLIKKLTFNFEKNNLFKYLPNNNENERFQYNYSNLETAFDYENINRKFENDYKIIDKETNLNLIKTLQNFINMYKLEDTNQFTTNTNFSIKNLFNLSINFEDGIPFDTNTKLTLNNFNINDLLTYKSKSYPYEFNFKTNFKINNSAEQNIFEFNNKKNDAGVDKSSYFIINLIYNPYLLKEFTTKRIKDIDQLVVDNMTSIISPIINVDNDINKLEQKVQNIHDIYKFNELSNQMSNLRFYKT